MEDDALRDLVDTAMGGNGPDVSPAWFPWFGNECGWISEKRPHGDDEWLFVRNGTAWVGADIFVFMHKSEDQERARATTEALVKRCSKSPITLLTNPLHP